MQLNLTTGLSRIVPIAFAALSLCVSSAFAATNNVTINLNGKSFGNGKNLHAESVGHLNPSMAYTFALNGTLNGTGSFTFLNGISLGDLLDAIEPGGSSKLTKLKLNPSGTLPVTQLYRHVYSGAFKSFGVTFSLTISSKIDSTGKVKIDVRDVSIAAPSGPLSGEISLGGNSNLTVSTAPIVKFLTPGKNVSETAGFIDVVVIRRGNPKGQASVEYSVAPSTATQDDDYAAGVQRPGVDYTALAGTVTFLDGQTKKVISLSITNKTPSDFYREFTVNLSSPAKGITLDLPATETIGILNAR